MKLYSLLVLVQLVYQYSLSNFERFFFSSGFPVRVLFRVFLFSYICFFYFRVVANTAKRNVIRFPR